MRVYRRRLVDVANRPVDEFDRSESTYQLTNTWLTMQARPTRRELLQTLGTLPLVTPGCLATESPSTSATDTDSSPTPTERRPTHTATEVADCTEPRRPEVPAATEGDNVEPRNYPEKPDELSVETVESYVREFERAYKVNRAIQEYDLVRYDFLSWGVSDVHEVEGGFVATVGGQVAPFWYRGTTTESTPYHADEDYVASFLVSDRAVWRASGVGSDPPDPKAGELLVCTP